MPALSHTPQNVRAGRDFQNPIVLHSLFTAEETETQGDSYPGTHNIQSVAELGLDRRSPLSGWFILFLSFLVVPTGSGFCLDSPVL